MTAIKKDSDVRDSTHAHELGGSLGMTVGGVAGGFAGIPAGPVGIVAGAAVGGALGGSAGEKIAREVNPTREEEYWEKNHYTRSYPVSGHDFESYRPAYRSGINAFIKNPEKSFESLEPSLRNNWNIDRGESTLEWEHARHAARDAFTHLSGAV